MTRHLARALAAILALPLAVAPANGLSEHDAGEFSAVYDDGPYSHLPADAVPSVTASDLSGLLDLDGDPTTLSADEARMAALLVQVLFGDPTERTLDAPGGSAKPVPQAGL